MAAISPALQTHRSLQKCLLAPLALLALSKTPPLLTQRKLRHRSTRTLNPLADAPPHHASPIFINTQHTSHRPLSPLHPKWQESAHGIGVHISHLGRLQITIPQAQCSRRIFFVLNDLFYVLFFFFFKFFLRLLTFLFLCVIFA